MKNDSIQINIRIPADLKERLEQAADDNKRSTTAEIAARLEGSFEASVSPASGDDVLARVVANKVVEALDQREKKKKKA